MKDEPRSSPTKDGDCKGDLSFVTWMGGLGITDGPEHGVELNQLVFAEQLLRLFLIHNRAFFGQGIPCPLMKFCLATGHHNLIQDYLRCILHLCLPR